MSVSERCSSCSCPEATRSLLQCPVSYHRLTAQCCSNGCQTARTLRLPQAGLSNAADRRAKRDRGGERRAREALCRPAAVVLRRSVGPLRCRLPPFDRTWELTAAAASLSATRSTRGDLLTASLTLLLRVTDGWLCGALSLCGLCSVRCLSSTSDTAAASIASCNTTMRRNTRSPPSGSLHKRVPADRLCRRCSSLSRDAVDEVDDDGGGRGERSEEEEAMAAAGSINRAAGLALATRLTRHFKLEQRQRAAAVGCGRMSENQAVLEGWSGPDPPNHPHHA